MDGSTAGARRRFLAAVLAALVLHALALAPLAGLLAPGPPGEERGPIRVSLFEAATRAPSAYEPPKPIPEGQVADAPEVEEARREADDRARFLSESAQRVERQTRSRVRVVGEHRVGGRTAAPGARTGPRTTPGVVGPSATGIGPGDAGKERDEFILIGPDQAAAAAARAAPAGALRSAEPAGERGELQGGSGDAASTSTSTSTGSGRMPPGDLLTPTVEVLAQAAAGAAMDHLEGIEEGETTALSTRPFAHAGFYRRVRDQVSQYWDPRGAFAIGDPYGRQYGYRDRRTVVLVTLDCGGDLLSASLLEDSGASFLDEEAVTAIEQGAPFHNPPRDLCDARRGVIRFTFGFYVETDQGPTLRVRVTR